MYTAYKFLLYMVNQQKPLTLVIMSHSKRCKYHISPNVRSYFREKLPKNIYNKEESDGKPQNEGQAQSKLRYHRCSQSTQLCF